MALKPMHWIITGDVETLEHCLPYCDISHLLWEKSSLLLAHWGVPIPMTVPQRLLNLDSHRHALIFSSHPVMEAARIATLWRIGLQDVT